MKSPFVSELEPNRVITTSFLVHSKEIRQKKSGELYLSLLLADRTGELDAKMWDNVNEFLEAFDRDDFVKVKGLIQIFHNRPQLTIHKVRRMDDSEIEFADYFPSSKRDPEEMWAELRGIVAGLSNPHLRALLDAMLADPDIAARFRRAPAAKHIHHAFLGGLIEHVLSLCALAKRVAPHYATIDLDLLLTGVVLHDIGKIYELNYERGFSYSNDGQLVGHIAIALRMVADKLRGLPDFPPRLRVLVEHMILSHHGHLEFGSPKVPQFPEALMLHYLDDLDSKMECMRALVQNDRQLEGCFTGYSSTLERTVLKMDRYWAEETPAPRAGAVDRGPGVGADDFGPTAAPVPSAPAGKAAIENAAPAQHLSEKDRLVQSSLGGQNVGLVTPAVLPQVPREPAPAAKPRVENTPAAAPAKPAPAPTPPAQHALFASKPDSLFADKLRQALKPAVAQERTEQQVAE
jgi:3'-5' exoribonuclease